MKSTSAWCGSAHPGHSLGRSIHSLGAQFYSPDIISVWGAPRDGERYRKAMQNGEYFFIAVRDEDEESFLGFSSYRFTEGKHRTAVYARGDAARIGVERALFDRAEAAALEHGATEIHVDASLAAVQFYIARGFEELAPGQHRMRNGAFMDCVFMKKKIGQTHIRPSDLFPKGSLVQHAMSCFAMLEPSEASFKMKPCVGKAKWPFEN